MPDEPRKPSVYLETTIVSYLTARPSRDIIALAHQQRTGPWWHEQRKAYRLFISPFVLQEAERGDPEAAQRRMSFLADIPSLVPVPPIEALARDIKQAVRIPDSSLNDAFHLACAIHYGLDYLLTWNCTHIAGARSQKRLREFTRDAGLWLPIICTPDEMLGEDLEMNTDV
jgi:predicted nucleic acid-binding protein